MRRLMDRVEPDKTMTTTERHTMPGGLLAGLATAAPAHAAEVEGDLSVNAAALLVVLGIWALAMGVRNLRAMRYKPLVPQRRPQQDAPEALGDVD